MAETQSFPDPMSLVPDFLTALGRVTRSFGLLEDELDGFIADLLGGGMAAGQAVTFTVRNISDRIKLAKALVDIRPKGTPAKTEAEKMWAKIVKLKERRNALTHHGVVQITGNVDPDEHEVTFRKKDYLFKAQTLEKHKTKDLTKLSNDLDAMAYTLAMAAHTYRVSTGHADRFP